MKLDADLLRELTEMFVAEAREYLEGISRALLELERLPPSDQPPVLAEIFRQAHSLKGSARAVGVSGVELLANELESTFSVLKTEKRAPSPELVDRIFKALDTIGIVVAVTAGEQADGGVDIEQAVRRLKGEEAAAEAPPLSAPPPTADPIAVPSSVERASSAEARTGIDAVASAPPPSPQRADAVLSIPQETAAAQGFPLPMAPVHAGALPMHAEAWGGNNSASIGQTPPRVDQGVHPTEMPRAAAWTMGASSSIASPVPPAGAPASSAPASSAAASSAPGGGIQAASAPAAAAPAAAAPAAAATPGPVRSAPSPRSESSSKGPEETVRVAVSKLDALMASVGELHITLQAAERQVEAIREDLLTLERWRSEFRKLKGMVKRARKLLSQGHGLGQFQENGPRGAGPEEVLGAVSSFLQDTWERFARLEAQLGALRRDQRRVGTAARTLMEDVHHVRMQPFSTLLDTYPRTVRDLCRELGKEVELQTSGGEVELDRSLLEQLRAPLLHILRNCLDHGFETPAQRTRAGKAPQGTLQLRTTQAGDRIRITVQDDGAGIDLERVRSAAVEKGILSEEAARALSEHSVVQLIFHSGLSTRQAVSHVSGRGVGMDVVREVIERLHGEIEVHTRPGEGTTFVLSVPLTVAATLCLLVEVSRQRLALPVAQVVRLLRVRRTHIQRLEGGPAVSFGARLIPLVRLSEALSMDSAGREDALEAPAQILVLGQEERAVGFEVDVLLGARELVLKQLPRPFVRVKNISGASILGDGSVLPILNASDLLRSAARLRTGSRSMDAGTGAVKPDKNPTQQKTRILVVDDSISTRTLEKNILEAAGYEVLTGTDGLDAWQLLQREKVSLVISDVNMPRMEGVELVEKIRADKRLQHLPFILVTSLDSKEDREKGLQAGADAYFTKGDFDQGNLLTAVRRLI